MKRAFVLVSFILAVPIFAADSPLTNVHTIYLGNIDLREQRDIKLALKNELPSVRVVAREKDADVTLSIGGKAASTETITTSVNVIQGSTSSTGVQEKTVRVPTDTQISDPGHAVVSAVTRDGRTLTLHEGFPTEFTANHVAAAFIKAWREVKRPLSS